MEDGLLISITDEEGNDFNLEVVGNIEYEGEDYVVFLPADMSDDNPDYGLIILHSVEEDGEEEFASVDDEELLEKLLALYMEELENMDDDEEDSEG